jgi:hypothetical protein
MIRHAAIAGARRAKAWTIENPLYALVLLAAVAAGARFAWRAADRAQLVLWPPSVSGSWWSDDFSDLSLSLEEQNRHITGTGSARGNTLISVSGVGTGQSADLTLTFRNDADGSVSVQVGAVASMPDRRTLVLRLTVPSQDTRPFDETAPDLATEYFRVYGRPIERILKRR